MKVTYKFTKKKQVILTCFEVKSTFKNNKTKIIQEYELTASVSLCKF